MKKTVTKQDFINEFKNSYRKDNFSTQGLEKLFDYFEYFEDETNEQIELDVIAICCDFTEYTCLKDLQNSYDVPNDFAKAKEYLENRTQVICFKEDCILIQNY